MRKFIVLFLILLIAGTALAELGAYGRGGGNPLTAIKRALPIYNSAGAVIGYIALNDSSGLHLPNDIWLTADSSDGTLMHLFQVKPLGEFVTGEDLYLRKLALTPGANLVIANMDTLDEQGGSIAAGELSFQFTIADSELVKVYSDYDGEGVLDSIRVDINAMLSVADTARFASTVSGGGDITTSDGAVAAAVETVATLGVGATTFAVDANVCIITGDGGGNTVATITGGVAGQLLTLIFVDGLVVISNNDGHGANTVDLDGANDFTSADDSVLQLVFDGTSWYKVSASIN